MVASQFGLSPRPDVGQIVVLFPGALGDFVCLLESLGPLSRTQGAPILAVTNPAWSELLHPGPFSSLSIDSRAVSQLFGGESLHEARAAFGKARAIYSWTGSRSDQFERRLRQVSPASIAVFPFRDFRPGEHAAEYYARCLGLAPEPPQVFSSGDAMSWAQSTVADLRRPILALHAGSGSARKNWTGFEELTGVWRESGSVVEIRGPAETFRPVGADRQIEVSLGRVAALLRCVDVYVGNDSGITHLAAAVGQRGTAVYGDTDLPHWRPRSPSISVVTAAGAPCTSCAEPGICIHRMSVGAVLLSLRQALQT